MPRFHPSIAGDSLAIGLSRVQVRPDADMTMAYYKPLRVLLPIAFLWFALHDGVEARETRLVPGVDNNGERIYLESHRTPALYTGDFGDCGGGGDDVFSITKFDAGLYTDNFTVLFNMHGSTTLRKENVMCTYIYSSHLRKRANRSQYTCR